VPDPLLVRIEWAELWGSRPRAAGSNARLGPHGATVRVPLARLTLDDGTSGFGLARPTRAEAQDIVGSPLSALFSTGEGATSRGLPVDIPLWDLVSRREGVPAYAMAARMTGRSVGGPLRPPCYDTSLYFDDLQVEDDREAARLIAEEALQGRARGHRHFKIKVGRGARHLELDRGTRRDVAVVQAVREAVGPDAELMIDANDGYNLNLTKHVLDALAGCRPYWIEEAFHEDPVLYADLREWMGERGLRTLIADGEGRAAPSIVEWAERGLVDVVQFDILGHGFSRWLATGRRLDGRGVRSAPHHYGLHLGNFVAAHLAGALEKFAFVEWDEASTPGIDAAGYRVEAGRVQVPDAPGFGIDLDGAVFAAASREGGFTVS
jgi:L-rhamnonate dehydratase